MGNKTEVILSYLHDGMSYTDKMASSYWNIPWEHKYHSITCTDLSSTCQVMIFSITMLISHEKVLIDWSRDRLIMKGCTWNDLNTPHTYDAWPPGMLLMCCHWQPFWWWKISWPFLDDIQLPARWWNVWNHQWNDEASMSVMSWLCSVIAFFIKHYLLIY